MGKHSKNRGGNGMILALALGTFAAVTLFEKGDALRQVSENWKVTGFKIHKIDGTNAVLRVQLEFYNTSRRAAVLDALVMTVKKGGEVLGLVRLPAKATIKPQGTTVVVADVTVDVLTLLRKSVNLTEATKLLAQLKTKSLTDAVTLLQSKAGLRDVAFAGHLIVAGVQKSFSFVTDLGNVTRPVTPKLGPATDTPSGATDQTA